ncbi:MAG: demethoxyubiquinone hydroxylase family protein [Gemmobacter sp.]
MTPAERISIARIAKVNHAGEYGAIRIYGAQIAVSRVLWPRLVAALSDLRGHEVAHCRQFRAAMADRQARPCRIMPLWSVGGAVLGGLTALMGPKVIWACTEAVEDTVHRHLTDQLHYLQSRDPALHGLIDAIRAEEEGHLSLAIAEKQGASALTRAVEAVIRASVNAAIWMSTWGDSSAMRRDLAGAA